MEKKKHLSHDSRVIFFSFSPAISVTVTKETPVKKGETGNSEERETSEFDDDDDGVVTMKKRIVFTVFLIAIRPASFMFFARPSHVVCSADARSSLLTDLLVFALL